jgi:type IV secretory pathway VirB4 component
MSQEPPATTLLCSKYQKLLEESKHAREIWEQRRTEICGPRLVGKEAGDELLRLQATYGLTWREYESRVQSLLQKHVNTCLRCQLVSRIASAQTKTTARAA